MKLKYISMLTVLSLLTLTGCDSNTNSDSTSPDNSTDLNSSLIENSSEESISQEVSSEVSLTEELSSDVSEETSSEVSSSSQEPSDDPIIDDIDKNMDSFIISNINDTFNENETEKVYKLYADHDDKYVLMANSYIDMIAYNENLEVIGQAMDELLLELNENDNIYLKVIKQSKDINIDISAYYMNNPIKLPYQTNILPQEIDTSYSDASNLLQAATVNYVKREDGTYVYSNNPELFTNKDVNTCLMKNENLTGEVYMAFEHANYSSYAGVYLGYKLVNETDHDIYVTIENVGFQAGGSWFGQLAWYDFYNTKFQLPNGYLDANGAISGAYASYDYGYQDYTPRIYTPTTYKIPANESFFVIGGTSNESYNKINIDNSANKPLGIQRCSNGQVKFDVSNGSVTGLMLVYNDVKKISDDMEEVGYVTLRDGSDYGRQYQGIAHHKGVIDNNMMWEFNDKTRSQLLPVKYTNKRAFSTSNKKPYEEYDNEEVERKGTSWMTHLNPQNDYKAVGMDMVDFICKTTTGKEVIIDSYHADGSGEPANTANWMIEYQDNFTFVNRGNNTRKVVLKLKDNGTLATLVRDSKGNVLQTFYSIGLAQPNFKTYTFEVKPQESLQVVLDYLLVACSYGNVLHEVELI